jgi:hypothetical protein
VGSVSDTGLDTLSCTECVKLRDNDDLLVGDDDDDAADDGGGNGNDHAKWQAASTPLEADSLCGADSVSPWLVDACADCTLCAVPQRTVSSRSRHAERSVASLVTGAVL